MNDVAGSKDARHVGLVLFINIGSAGDGVKQDASFFAQFIFGDETNREQERIARDDLFGARDEIPLVIDRNRFNGFDAVFPMNLLDGMLQLQGNAPVLKTLNIVAAQAG